jgi:polyhydroxybutyrate depolymerase
VNRHLTPESGVDIQTRELVTVRPARRYILLRPTGSDGRSMPVVVDLHGSGSWPEEHVAVTDARELAASGAVVVVPEAAIPFQFMAGSPRGLAWHVPGSPLPGESTPRAGPDDIEFVEALVDEFDDRRRVGQYGVHLRGYSGGARLAAHVAARIPDRLASVCCVAGVRHVDSAGRRLPPLLAIHGEMDTVNPFQGGSGSRWVESVPQAVGRWAAGAGAHPVPRARPLSDTVTELSYPADDGSRLVRLISIADADHSWPGTSDEEHRARFGAAGAFSASRAHRDFLREVERARGAMPRQ